MILRGKKGGGSSSTPTRKPDTLRSEDTLEVILALGEGEWKGLVEGGKSFYVGDTPLLNAEGELNFGDFEMLFFPGSGVNEVIRPVLGGISNSTNVGVELLNQTPVVRTGQTTDIDYIDIRLVVQALYLAKENGDTLENTLQLEIVYKPTSSDVWQTAYFNVAAPPTLGVPGGNYIRESGDGLSFYSPPSAAPQFTREVPRLYWQGSAPSGVFNRSVWFDNSGALIVVKQWQTDQWVTLSTQDVAGQGWSFAYGDDTVDVYVGTTGKTVGGNKYDSADGVFNSTVWLSSTQNRPLIWIGGAWVDINPYAPSAAYVPPGTVGSGSILTIRGKTTSTYVKEIQIPVQRVNDTYDIRITKISKDPGQDGDTENFIVVQWESFQEVKAGDLEFPNTACVHLVGVASGQFNGVPEFSGIYDGMIINVPSNYDPVTRTYTGIWDGTWKREYSNNPAYIWNDLQVNDRYGRSAYFPVTPNKWDVYEAGVYCDEPVPDGKGGTQPRWTFNQYITDAQGVKELSRYLAGTFTGIYGDDTNGGVGLRVDKERAASAIFTRENVTEGLFTYSFADVSVRYNDVTVSWVNPDLFYNEDRVRVKDDAHIAKYGRIPTDIVAFGCRDRAEAVRRGRAALIAATTEFTTVEFKTNRQAQQLDLYDTILISDPTLGYGVSGRVKSYGNADKTIWNLFEPIYLEVGVTYTVNVAVPNPTYPADATNALMVVSRSLDASQPRGLVNQLILAGGALSLPDYAVYSLEAAGYLGLPKPFRVLSIVETDGNADDVTITALEINRAKWDYIDNGTLGDPPVYSAFLTNQADAPKNLRVFESTRLIDGVEKTVLTLKWDRGDNPAVRQFRVHMKRNNGPMTDLGLTTLTEWEFADPPLGDYIFYVASRTLSGVEGQPVSFAYSFIGDAVPLKNPLNLRVQDGVNDTTFDVKSPVLIWD